MLGVFVLTLFAALSWTLLFAYLLYGGLNIVTSIVAAMLIGLYVDYMILAYHRFDGELRGGSRPLQALEATFSDTGKALLSSAATSAVAFFSVVVTDFRGLHELGVVAGFGILFCLVSTFLVFCPLLSLLSRGPGRVSPRGVPGGIPTGWAERQVDGRGGVVIAVFCALLLLAAAGATRTRFDADVESVGLANSEVRDVERAGRGEVRQEGRAALPRREGGQRLAARGGFRPPRSAGGAVAAVRSGRRVLFPLVAAPSSASAEGVPGSSLRRRPAGPVRRSRARKSGPEGDGGAGNGAR